MSVHDFDMYRIRLRLMSDHDHDVCMDHDLDARTGHGSISMSDGRLTYGTFRGLANTSTLSI